MGSLWRHSGVTRSGRRPFQPSAFRPLMEEARNGRMVDRGRSFFLKRKERHSELKWSNCRSGRRPFQPSASRPLMEEDGNGRMVDRAVGHSTINGGGQEWSNGRSGRRPFQLLFSIFTYPIIHLKNRRNENQDLGFPNKIYEFP